MKPLASSAQSLGGALDGGQQKGRCCPKRDEKALRKSGCWFFRTVLTPRDKSQLPVLGHGVTGPPQFVELRTFCQAGLSVVDASYGVLCARIGQLPLGECRPCPGSIDGTEHGVRSRRHARER